MQRIGTTSHKEACMLFKELRIQQEQIEQAKKARDIQYEETEQVPAMPKESSFPGVPYPSYPPNNPCPYWHAPIKRNFNLEEYIDLDACKRWFYRAISVAAMFYILALVAILLQKVMVMVLALK